MIDAYNGRGLSGLIGAPAPAMMDFEWRDQEGAYRVLTSGKELPLPSCTRLRRALSNGKSILQRPAPPTPAPNQTDGSPPIGSIPHSGLSSQEWAELSD